MNVMLVNALLKAYSDSVRLAELLLSKASPEKVTEFVDMLIERDLWFQENLWGPLGDEIKKARENVASD